MEDISDKGKKIVKALKQAVDTALERKRKLGQYVVVTGKDGTVKAIGEDAPTASLQVPDSKK